MSLDAPIELVLFFKLLSQIKTSLFLQNSSKQLNLDNILHIDTEQQAVVLTAGTHSLILVSDYLLRGVP